MYVTQPPGPPPLCPDGHGSMNPAPGFWVLQGVRRNQPTGLLDLQPAGFGFTGEGMVVKVWICPSCGLTRLYADDKD